jgi:broad specificity phosphatase PhoE
MTTLYLLRHGATQANLERPYRLQGRRSNPPLAPLGIRQAELTRALLAGIGFDRAYSSPLSRARQTARIIAAPHRRRVHVLDQLTECDVGRWEGLTWETIRSQDRRACQRFESNPARHGYPEGESFQQVAERANTALDALLDAHPGETLLVVGHHVVNRVYLAGLLGLPLAQAKRVRLDNCGISIVVREGSKTRVATLNATFHLRELEAA